MSEGDTILTELLRLYDWRVALGAIEKYDPQYDKKLMAADLLKYGREKRAAWIAARTYLNRDRQIVAGPPR